MPTQNLQVAPNPLVYAFGEQPIWCSWRMQKDKDGRPTKVPLAKSNDPTTWKTFAEIQATTEGDGTGIMFPPDKLLLGIDLDHCIEGGELIKEELREFLTEARTYTEVSPSGTGLHLFFLLQEPATLKKNRSGDIEVYNTHRFFTVTQESWGKALPVRIVGIPEMQKLLRMLGYPWSEEGGKTVETPKKPEGEPERSDAVVKRIMFESKVGKKAKSVWDGDISEYDDDDSLADMGLVSHLRFFTGGNRAQTERLWLSSPLGARDKTQKREDYRSRTLDAVWKGGGEVMGKKVTDVMEGPIQRMQSAMRAAKSWLDDAYKDGDFKEINKAKKALKDTRAEYSLIFDLHFAQLHPHLLYETGEDSTYWDYDKEEGIYVEMNKSEVRSMLIRDLKREDMDEYAKENYCRDCLARYRAHNSDRARTYDDFDADGDWFHASNGWVHLETREFEPHSPSRNSRRKSAVVYDSKAKCPRYDAFLTEDIQRPQDEVRVLKQFSGLILTPDISQQKMLTIIGKPGSGKSTLLDIWSYVLGDMMVKRKITDFSHERSRFIGASLIGRTLCWFDEAEVKKSEMGGGLEEQITGKTIHIERKGINKQIDVENKMKFVLSANTLPLVSELGVYRRLLIVPFERSFTNEMVEDRSLPSVLEAESSGVLNNMLDGLDDLRRMRGFTMVSGHDERIEEYKASSNTIAEFLDEYFEPDQSKAKLYYTSELFDAYINKFPQGGFKLTPKKFGSLLSAQPLLRFQHTLELKRDKTGRGWTGLVLKPHYRLEKSDESIPARIVVDDDNHF